MLLKPKDQPEPERLLELDREPWNLPTQPVAPAGPVSEVWPVHPTVASPRAKNRLAEGPALA